MKKIKVIKMKNLPARFPIIATIVWWMLLDHFHVPPVAWGVFYTLAGLIWIISIAAVFMQESVDVIERSGK
ncbi:hypothetical protein PQR71_41960 [Paraburkholderia fungorum]|uniref:hypothetical protein n=1 Tax=Paraburkholderia fungorum TaxID=134537 RepID=UPI0038BC1429